MKRFLKFLVETDWLLLAIWVVLAITTDNPVVLRIALFLAILNLIACYPAIRNFLIRLLGESK